MDANVPYNIGNNVMFTCRSHLVWYVNRSCSWACAPLSICLSFTLPSPLGSFYPIKFIRSNMWIWHQRHRQLCDLHFVLRCVPGCVHVCYFSSVSVSVIFFFVVACWLSCDRRWVCMCSHLNCWCWLLLVSFSYIFPFCIVLLSFGLMIATATKCTMQISLKI